VLDVVFVFILKQFLFYVVVFCRCSGVHIRLRNYTMNSLCSLLKSGHNLISTINHWKSQEYKLFSMENMFLWMFSMNNTNFDPPPTHPQIPKAQHKLLWHCNHELLTLPVIKHRHRWTKMVECTYAEVMWKKYNFYDCFMRQYLTKCSHTLHRKWHISLFKKKHWTHQWMPLK